MACQCAWCRAQRVGLGLHVWGVILVCGVVSGGLSVQRGRLSQVPLDTKCHLHTQAPGGSHNQCRPSDCVAVPGGHLDSGSRGPRPASLGHKHLFSELAEGVGQAVASSLAGGSRQGAEGLQGAGRGRAELQGRLPREVQIGIHGGPSPTKASRLPPETCHSCRGQGPKPCFQGSGQERLT